MYLNILATYQRLLFGNLFHFNWCIEFYKTLYKNHQTKSTFITILEKNLINILLP